MKGVSFLCVPSERPLGSTILRAHQLCQIVLSFFPDVRAVLRHDSNDIEPGSTVILTKHFLITSSVDEVVRLKQNSHFLLADYLDARIEGLIPSVVDGFIASSHAQLVFLQRVYPDKPSWLVNHHVDLRIPRLTAPKDRYRAAYFGELYNARFAERISHSVRLFDTSVISGQANWRNELANFNCHYAVRNRQAIDGFKPFTKGFLAAHCLCPVVTTRSEDDAAAFLPDDYPYFVEAPDAETLVAELDRVRSTFGSSEWTYAVEAMRGISEQCSPSTVARQFSQMHTDVLAFH